MTFYPMQDLGLSIVASYLSGVWLFTSTYLIWY